MDATSLSEHWDGVYSLGEETRSWHQDAATLSLELIDHAGVGPDTALIDVGGGASPLVGALHDQGWGDLTVLDVSEVALGIARSRLGAAADAITWLPTSLGDWHPDRRYGVWHDRAVLHFMAEPDDVRLYLDRLNAATARGSVAVIGCFAPDGPERCSGLPAARRSPRQVAQLVGEAWSPVADASEQHTTPSGVVQSFAWSVLRRVR